MELPKTVEAAIGDYNLARLEARNRLIRTAIIMTEDEWAALRFAVERWPASSEKSRVLEEVEIARRNRPAPGRPIQSNDNRKE